MDQEHVQVLDRPTGPSPGVPLLTSKLAAPTLPDGLVVRRRLLEMLDEAVQGPLTVITAPAGWGKTALLNSWVREGGPAHTVTWLTVESDDEGGRFWSYLHYALSASGATMGEDHQAVPAPGFVAHSIFLAELANALARLAGPVVVVLDDFDRVLDPGIPDGLAFLLRHAAARLHIVLATRAEPALPLHRWRLSGELTELRARELAFTPAEAAQLLSHHAVELPDAHQAALLARTEGWPAGLRLAALDMREHPDPPRYVDLFTGAQPAIAEYLIGEVLDAQPPDVRHALLCTSLLERVCGGLVNALTGRTDGDRILADLEHRNAFTIPLAGRYPWCRHHRLFGELLRAELRRTMPDQVPELHGLAATWYATHGQPADALRHALAARNWADATTLLRDRWQDLVLCRGDDHLRTLVPPPPDGTARTDRELALAYAADRLDLGDLDAVDGCLRLADTQPHQVTQEGGDRFAAMHAAVHLARARLAGDTPAVLSFAGRLLALVGDGGSAGGGGLAGGGRWCWVGRPCRSGEGWRNPCGSRVRRYRGS